MKINKISRLFLLFVLTVLSFGVIACEEETQKSLDGESEAEGTNDITNTEQKQGSQEHPDDESETEEINTVQNQVTFQKETQPELSEDDIVKLVESIDPFKLKPSMTLEERYDLRKEMYENLSNDGIHELSDTITDLSLLLTGTVADDLYKNLINKSDPKWDALEVSNCYYAREKLESITHLVNYQPLLDDLNMVIELCEEGVEHRDILKIVDTHRILYDISNHLFNVPFAGPGEETVNYYGIHDMYFNASTTLEESYNLISN
ncbi:hypothetical protein [Oceanobacillus sp. AG]|uniref:hypothetical protein n=1 Tax=Oceanobacillus sp. AG TaxID=2681969 RepID=UPI0012EBBB45|nr:hypothetical protein [Oceanobacillus sp. AG]